MKVKNLIELLQNENPDAEVLVGVPTIAEGAAKPKKVYNKREAIKFCYAKEYLNSVSSPDKTYILIQ